MRGTQQCFADFKLKVILAENPGLQETCEKKAADRSPLRGGYCQPGYGLKPTPGAFGAWSRQPLGLLVLNTAQPRVPPKDEADLSRTSRICCGAPTRLMPTGEPSSFSNRFLYPFRRLDLGHKGVKTARCLSIAMTYMLLGRLPISGVFS